MKKGIRISQQRARELSQFEIYLSPSTDFWIRTDSVDMKLIASLIHKDGVVEEMPDDAFPFHFEITLSEASESYGIPYSTLAEWARTGKLDSRKSGGTWLTTSQAIERLLKS